MRAALSREKLGAAADVQRKEELLGRLTELYKARGLTAPADLRFKSADELQAQYTALKARASRHVVEGGR